MKKNYVFKMLIYLLICAVACFVGGCSGNSGESDPVTKAKLSLQANGSKDIYDMLEDYPGLESLFTAGDMTIAEFEDLLFEDFLGDIENADAMIYVKDSFPKLINSGTSTAAIFSKEVEEEMASKGAVPDFLGTFSVFSEAILNLEDDQKESIYLYLDELVKIDSKDADQRRLFDYLDDILYDFIGYLNTIEAYELNNLMQDLIVESLRFKVVEDGKLDFVDFDDMIHDFTEESPEGMVEIFEGLKELAGDEETKEVLKKIFTALGEVFEDPEAFPVIKTLFTKGYDRYSRDTLGEILDRIWNEGPIIGPDMTKMGIETFGKDGEMPHAVQEMLMKPEIISLAMEVIYNFKKEGFGFEKTDDAIRRLMVNNPLCSSLDGEGEYGNGEFYQPNGAEYSYKDLTGFEGLIALLTRWDVPFTFTCPFLHEKTGSEFTKAVFRTVFPKVDSFPCSNLIWSEIWEKDENAYMGNGHLLEDHKELYGKMQSGKFTAPLAPGLISPIDLALYLFGDSVLNGPYDNIYDNFRWVLYEREIYMVIDLPQIAPYLVPPLGSLITQAFKMVGVNSYPITLAKFTGGVEMINWELGEFVQHAIESVSMGMIQIGIPEVITGPIVKILLTYFLPLGNNVENSNKNYLMSQDIRDLATIVYSSCFYDEKAFDFDTFLDTKHPETYARFYNVENYRYKTHPDKANHFFNFSGALCVAAVKAYNQAVEGIPPSIACWEERQTAAIEKMGVVFPTSYMINLVAPFTEVATEESIYHLSYEDVVPLIQYLEPLLLKDRGVFENFFNLIAVMGKPENKTAREKTLNGLAKLIGTIDKDSQSLYTFAGELLRLTETAIEDESRWDSFETFIKGWGQLLDKNSEYSLVSDFIDFLDYMIRVDLTGEDYTNAADAVCRVLNKTTSERIFTRGFIHLTTLFDEFDKFHNWTDTAYMLENAVHPDYGVLSYVFKGLEKDPEMPWSVIIEDTNRFLHSEIMQSYDDGSFWKDIYQLLEFLSDAVEAPEDM